MDENAHKNREWLRKQVTALFEDAKAADEPDHVVCAKYAEILHKLMPPDPPTTGQPVSPRMARLLDRYEAGGYETKA